MLWVDLMTYLPDDILVKVDRMSMACSLETRVPLLDHKIIEFMAEVPKKQKFSLNQSKLLLRRDAEWHLPASILQRPKQGFAIPLGGWLQKELRPWMDELLLGDRSWKRSLFSQAFLARMIGEHVEGRRDFSQQLWALMVLEGWFQHAG